jgi:hypothetical protein
MRTSKPRLEQVARAPLFWLAILYVLVGVPDCLDGMSGRGCSGLAC